MSQQSDIGVDLTEARIQACRAAGVWSDETLGRCLDRWARECPDKIALVDRNSRMTYGQVAHSVECIAQGLAALGVEPGSAVSCQLQNRNEAALVFLATERLGAIVNPIPPTYRANELRFILGLLESQVLVIPSTFRNFDYVAMAKGLRGDLPTLRHVFAVDGAGDEGVAPFSQLTGTDWETRGGRRLPGVQPDRVHEVIFTSGTTGEPKGVMHTPNTALTNARLSAGRFGYSASDVTLMPSTLGHQTGFLFGYCMTVLSGSTVVWMDIWNPQEAAELIARERVTFTIGATPFLQDLTYVPGDRDFSSLRLFVCAGAPIPRPLIRDAKARLGCAISAGWGMTENGCVTCNRLDDPEDKIAGFDGVALPGLEVCVVGEDGKPLPLGEEGDLLTRGATQFVGYYKRPAFTRDSYAADGWFKTGDRATMDRDGYIAITGRSKDLIIRGGENIPVAEIENILYTHPKLAGVAVVALPDPRLQERACAVVIPREGETVTLKDITSFLEAHQVAKFKLPERLEIVSEFPYTPSGKIQKYRLREIVRERVAKS